MKQSKYNSIHEVAKLFGITVPTLHFWESKNLFHISKNTQNKYREFKFSDILNIWEIVFYRKLNIPIKDIQKILKNDLSNLEQIYSANEDKLINEIEKLNKNLDYVRKQKKIIQVVKELKSRGLQPESPDFTLCQRDYFELDTLHASLINPYCCCMKISSDFTTFERGIQVDSCDKKNVLWESDSNSSENYYSFLLKININNQSDNNLPEILEQIHGLGLTPREVIARYLLVVSEPSSTAVSSSDYETPPRYEYYKAWIRVN